MRCAKRVTEGQNLESVISFFPIKLKKTQVLWVSVQPKDYERGKKPR